MRRFVKLLLLLILVCSLVGCGTKKKAEDAIVEKILENSTGSKVDIDKDKITIETKEGETMTIGSTEWPKSSLAKNVPEINDKKIVGVMDSEDYTMITLENIDMDFFTKYKESVKEMFTQDVLEAEVDGGHLYMGSNGDNIAVQLSFTLETETLGIVLSKAVE